MEIERDAKADAAYIYFSSKPYAYGKDLDDQRRVDYAADSTPIGVELLLVSSGVNVHGLPHQDEIAELLKANGIQTYSIDTWSASPAIRVVVFGVELTEPVSRQDTATTFLRTEPQEVTA